MANITRYNPFGEMTRFDPFGDIDDLFKGYWVRPLVKHAEPEVKIDLSEDDKAYIVHAEIPGVKKEDIKVQVEGNQVSISAEVKQEKEEKKDKKVLRTERYYGRVFRSFTLGQDMDHNAAKAKYSDGVLELTLPKKPGATAKEISVS